MERQSSSQRMRAQWQKGEEKRHSMYIIDNCCITAKAMAGVQKKAFVHACPLNDAIALSLQFDLCLH